MWEFTCPRTIVMGDDALEYLATIEGKRALIVTDKGVRSLGIVDRVAKYLRDAGLEVEIYDEVEREPSKQNILRGVEVARRFQPDWFVGLGGGSCMDAAKAIWVLYERPDLSIEEITPLMPLGLRKKARLICIPTTSGTGSDATWAVVITDAEAKRKMELASKEVVSDISILDHTLAKTMPPQLTASTGLDALTQGIEAYIAKWHNDFSDALAIWSVKLAYEYLPRAYRNPDDMEAREKMHHVATMSGIAFSNSQICSVHALGHAIGAVFKIPHGVSVAVFLPYVLEYNLKHALSRIADLARIVGIAGESDKEVAKKFIEDLRNFIKSLGVPTTLAELGISREQLEEKLEELVDKAVESTGTIANPRTPTREDYKRIILYAYEGKNIDF